MVNLATLGFDLVLHELDPFIGIHLVPLPEAQAGSTALTNIIVAAHYVSEFDVALMTVPEACADDTQNNEAQNGGKGNVEGGALGGRASSVRYRSRSCSDINRGQFLLALQGGTQNNCQVLRTLVSEIFVCNGMGPETIGGGQRRRLEGGNIRFDFTGGRIQIASYDTYGSVRGGLEELGIPSN
jgi:hypothetical protein